MAHRKREAEAMRVIPKYVYNPEKAERGLRAMADILAEAIRQTDFGRSDDSHADET